jgi:protoheme IX farnesyltransferase
LDQPGLLGRLADYCALGKPRIAVMALLTVAAGFVLGSAGAWRPAALLSAVVGIGLVAIGSSAWNQWLERRIDGLMRRTAQRPLPAGRLAQTQALAFAMLTSVAGLAWLAVNTNAATCVLTALTLLVYAGLYTPLKRRVSFATVVGAIPGAMPPVLGWVAAGAGLDWSAFSLFALLFLWQFPHFLAISWLYQEDYQRAGLKMLPGGASWPRVTGLVAVAYALALVPLSLFPAYCGLAGGAYAVVALALSLAYLVLALGFMRGGSPASARRLLLGSLVYLPVVLAALVWDHLRLLS